MSFRNKALLVANDLRIVWSILKNDGTLKAGQKCKVTIEVSSVCNLKCPLCPTGTGKTKRQNRFMPGRIFDRIVEVTRPVTDGYILSMWGEPALHPELDKLIEKIYPHPVWIAANLNYKQSIAETMARWDNLHVICAVDTLVPSEYEAYRVGGDYKVMLRNLDILAAGKCHTYPQFLVEAGKNSDMYDIFAREHNIPTENVIIKIKRENFTLNPSGASAAGTCHAPYSGIYFNSDGEMVPCCNDVGNDLVMAHIDHIDLDAIVGRSDLARVRRLLAKDKNNFPSCGQCKGETFWNTRLPVYKDYLAKVLFHSGKKSPQKMPFREPAGQKTTGE
ncbi:hypothetical protein GKC30_09250 [Pseudodesulfovibrio sp. F-1]|uniref:4Fe4S-binding SPASM domain-containing protein n=1 Tax=Pseudodesulfovibrio alkaliphilus TaxID=2661613 RepID=A0A7K1KP10_9BACT|nr:SPASM domain-containing protein [Pseudodesulfovibrio alkaliphilus]MUM77819.1 hypothetical protein [Pseudodesulfovibrio alkaliphilus]